MNFDWQTEDDDWEEEPTGEGRNTAEFKNGRLLLWAAAGVVLVVVSAVFLLPRFLEAQVNNATGGLEREVISANTLLMQSVLEEDFELFESFLSERNSYSRQLPLALYRNGYFLDRPFLSLYAQEDLAEPPSRVSFSPDLSEAEVVWEQHYRPEAGEAVETVTLERLTLLRQVDGRWQLRRWPIDEDFWGETVEERIGLLTAEYPARDEEYGRQLAPQISGLLDDICGSADVNCPPNFRLKVIFQPYGQSLLDMNRNYRTLPLSSGYDAYRIFLPAPTLTGRPTTAAGYEALYEGYGGWIAAVLVQHYSRIRPVTEAVTADFLAQWGLVPPPPPVLPGPLVENVEAPPIPLPEEDVLMVCQGYSRPTWIVYSPDDDSWQMVSEPDNAPAMGQLLQQAGQRLRFAPEGQGSLIRRPVMINQVQSWQSYLWLGGLSNLLETENNPDLLLADPRHQRPEDGRLLFYPFDGQGGLFVAETAGCLAGECGLEQLANEPVWSPSGGRSLLVMVDERNRPQLHLGDGDGRPLKPLNNGYAPQWLNEESFLYVGPSGTVIYQERLDGAGNLVESALLAGIPSFFSPQVLNETPRYAFITHIAVHPSQPEWAALNVHVTDTERGYLLLFNRQNENLRLGFSQTNYQFAYPFVFSDDGRYLTVPAFEAGTLSGGWRLLVLDLNTAAGNREYGTETAYFDWTADSRWLLIAEDDGLRLIAPEYNYERTIPHNLGCHAVGWWR